MDIIEILNNLSLESNIKLEEVPEIDLYMDQVIQLFESKLSNQKRNDEVRQEVKSRCTWSNRNGRTEIYHIT